MCDREGSSSCLISFLFWSLARRRARLFSISGCISKREGARGIEEGGRQMGRISTERVKSVHGRRELLAVIGLIIFIYIFRNRRWLCPRSPGDFLPPCLPPCPATTTTTRTKVITTSTIRLKVSFFFFFSFCGCTTFDSGDPPTGPGGYYPQQPPQAYQQGGYPQQGGYAPQPPPQVVYVYVLPFFAVPAPAMR